MKGALKLATEECYDKVPLTLNPTVMGGVLLPGPGCRTIFKIQGFGFREFWVQGLDLNPEL